MDVTKLITPQVETEILREQNKAQQERISQLEEQLNAVSPSAPFERKIMEWLEYGEGKVLFDDVKALKKFVDASRKRCETECRAKFHEMRLKHIPILERFQRTTGANFDIGALFDWLDGDDDKS